METATLKYGDTEITLRKSPDLIGLVTKGVLAPSVRRALVPETFDQPAGTKRGLGGFELHRVDPAIMEERLDELRESPAIRAGTHVYHTGPDDAAPVVPTGELYVRWAPDVSPDERNDVIAQLKLAVVSTDGPDGTLLRTTSHSENPVKVALRLQQMAEVDIAEPDLAVSGKLHAFTLPNDEDLQRQWHLRNTGTIDGNGDGLTAGADARVIDAWEGAGSLGSNGVIVAVIDDGFDLTHPDLSGPGKVVAAWDFTRGSDDPSPEYRLEGGVFDGDWHGTACAGVAVGGANGHGIVGAAPGCRLMPVRWGAGISDREVEDWFGFVREQGAWVVSCSWGVTAPIFPLSTRKKRAIEQCAREGRGGLGTVIVFAAGNEDSDVNDPATSVAGFAIHPDVICVAASTSRDQRAHYSNYGKEIWVCAPSSGLGGRGVVTADVLGSVTLGGRRHQLGYGRGGVTRTFGGTSSATPLVAGICAFILSLRPQMTATEVKDLLRRTARRIGDPADYNSGGHSRYFGYGCVDAAAAIAAIMDEQVASRPERKWGEKGHHSTNRIALSALPPSLAPFYAANADFIEHEAMAADHAKQRDPAERPRHYIDLDEYGTYPFRELPEERVEAEARYSPALVVERGLVPWIIDERYKALVKAFRDQDTTRVLHHSAWLGHYIGDAHVPLHTTANHNGQLTGQKGLHGHFESAVLEFVDMDEVRPAQAVPFGRPILGLAFEWLRESHLHIDTILHADLQARRGANRQRDKRRFAELVGNIALERLTYGSHRLACAWMSAWAEAGKPELTAETIVTVIRGQNGTAKAKRPKAAK